MIDTVVVVQAVVAGMILARACHEAHKWDRAGFALLAAAAGLMTLRRVTAQIDKYMHTDKVTLPTLITFVMLAAATCFLVDLAIRVIDRQRDPEPQTPRNFFRGALRNMWPAIFMLLVAAGDYVPAGKWDGVKASSLTFEESLIEAISGANTAAACEQIRWHCARGIDVLQLKAGSKDRDEATALQKLRALELRLQRTHPK